MVGGTFQKSMKLGIFYFSHDLIVDWLNALKPGAVNEEELTFIQLLLHSFKTDPKERPYARDLAEQIQAICKQRPYTYIGCCVLDDTVNDSSTLDGDANPA